MNSTYYYCLRWARGCLRTDTLPWPLYAARNTCTIPGLANGKGWYMSTSLHWNKNGHLFCTTSLESRSRKELNRRRNGPQVFRIPYCIFHRRKVLAKTYSGQYQLQYDYIGRQLQDPVLLKLLKPAMRLKCGCSVNKKNCIITHSCYATVSKSPLMFGHRCVNAYHKLCGINKLPGPNISQTMWKRSLKRGQETYPQFIYFRPL